MVGTFVLFLLTRTMISLTAPYDDGRPSLCHMTPPCTSPCRARAARLRRRGVLLCLKQHGLSCQTVAKRMTTKQIIPSIVVSSFMPFILRSPAIDHHGSLSPPFLPHHIYALLSVEGDATELLTILVYDQAIPKRPARRLDRPGLDGRPSPPSAVGSGTFT